MARVHPPELLERGDELAAAAAWLTEAASGHSRIVLVEGDAGAGKTSLVRAATGGLETWWGWCDPFQTPRPLGPLHDIAAEAGIVLSSDTHAAFGALLTALRARQAPIAVVIEDLHWADDATLAMLQFLGRRLDSPPVTIFATYRRDEATPQLHRLLGDLARHPDRLRRIEVGPLSDTAVAALAAGTGHDPAQVVAATGGNAFFVTELLAAADGVSPSLSDAVLARVAALPAEVREEVERVAADPRGLELRLVGEPDRAHGLLTLVGPDRIGFRHELARRAVYDALPLGRRIRLHVRLLDEIAGSPDLARVAHHAIGSRDAGLVAKYVPPAVQDAIACGANRQAVELVEALLVHEEQLAPDQVVDLLEQLGGSLAALDRQDEAVAALRRALRAVEQLGDERRRGALLTRLAGALWRTGDVAGCEVLRDRAVDVLRPLGPTPELAAALTFRARSLGQARLHAPAMAAVAEATEIAGRIDDEAGWHRACLANGAIEMLTGDTDRGVAQLTALLTHADRTGDATLRIDVLNIMSSAAGEARRYEQAFGWAQQLIDVSQERDIDYPVGYARAWQARMRFEQGRWDEATELAVAANGTDTAAPTRASALGVIGRLRVRRGDPRAPEALLEVRDLGTLGIQHRWPVLCGLAEWHWLSGDLETGAEVLQGLYRQVLATDSTWARGEVAYWLWRNGGLATPPPNAAEGFAASIAGDWAAAADAWGVLGCPYEQALALLDGDDDATAEGLLILDRLGARPAAALARRRLAERGITAPRSPRRPTLDNEWGLTAREAEIQELLIEGLDNPAIAARLFISRRTVEHHVSAVLRKRGVAGRADLT